MPISSQDTASHLQRLLEQTPLEEIRRRLKPRTGALPPKIPGASLTSEEAIELRWRLLGHSPAAKATLLKEPAEAGRFARNIENFIGTVELPIGLAGPLRVNGVSVLGD